MTNKQKERLKGIVQRWKNEMDKLDLDNEVHRENHWAKKQLHSLIDRQPTEGMLELINAVLDDVGERFKSIGHVTAITAINTIRKALNIEGKE